MTATYVVAMLYTLHTALAGGTVSELALGVLSGLSSSAFGIIGFWFGGRANQAQDRNPASVAVTNPSSGAFGATRQGSQLLHVLPEVLPGGGGTAAPSAAGSAASALADDGDTAALLAIERLSTMACVVPGQHV